MLSTNHNILFKATILALCVISFVHIFLFPLYDLNAGRSLTKTYADLEPTLCSGNINAKHQRYRSGPSASNKHSRQGRPCPQYGIVTVAQGGRLGNQMWEYASVWALARRTGLEPYIPRCIRLKLDQVFEALSVPTFEEIAHCPAEPSSFVSSLNAWNYTNQSILLPKFSFHVWLVVTWVQDIVQEFAIKKKLAVKSQQVLRLAAKNTSVNMMMDNDGLRNNGNGNGRVFVGVHVRRQDYIEYLQRSRKGVKPAGGAFFRAAMKYYEGKFGGEGGVVFVVVSDDTVWCRKKFEGKRNVYVTSWRKSAALDMAILAACNHSIYDYGTFGEWGAILAGGETVYYNTGNGSNRFLGSLANWHTV